MKQLALLIFLLATGAFAQNVRWDSQASTTNGTGQMLPMLALPGANVQFFVCSAGVCGTPATTYQTSTDTTGCPTGAQVVWQPPVGGGCVGTADSQGNFGGWFQPGLYQYFLTVSGVTAGPFWFSVGGGSGGGGSASPPQFTVQFACSATLGTFCSDPNITINPTAHSLTVAGTGTGVLKIGDITSGNYVSQTVQSGTLGYTFAWPLTAPGTYSSCLAAVASGNATFSGCIAGYSPGATIQSAVTAAGLTGPLIIPSPYPGGDSWTNPANIRVHDERPFNPTNATTYAFSLTPDTTLKARDYGALCNGGHDDTTAIQAAVNALVNVGGGQIGASNPPTTPATVELPQGTCIVRAPIQLPGYGSLVGSSNGTYILAANTFVCNTFGCDIVQLMIPYGFVPANTTTINRTVRNINFVYLANTTAITGVHVFNATGNTAATPYPSSAAPSLDQLYGVIIADNSFFAMDTGVRVDDCGECNVDRNQFRFLHIGLWENGNDYSFEAHENAFENGTGTDTPTTGNSIGFFASGRTAYYCSNNNPNCSGGTVTSSAIFPQGCTLESNTMAGWDNDVNIPNCQGIGLLGNGFDYGSDGANPGTANSTILLGQSVLIAQITNNFIAANLCNANGIEIGAPTSSAGSGPTYNDFLINGNYFTNYCVSTPTAAGILFDAGTNYRRGVRISDNTFANQGYGIVAQHGLQFSVIHGNYGFALSGVGALIDLNSAGAGQFQGTTIDDNSSSLGATATFYDQAGGGYYLGPTYSALGFQGTQSATAAGCTITAGAIGNVCGPVTLTFPTAFVNAGLSNIQCGQFGGTGSNGVTQVAISSASALTVYEVALSSTATGGGNLTCQAYHP